MGLALALVGVLLLFLSAVVASLVADEARAWAEHLADYMVRAAARALPPAECERYEEEWLAELEALPGASVSKLGWALQIFVRRRSLCRALGVAVRSRRTRPEGVFRGIGSVWLALLVPVSGILAGLITRDPGWMPIGMAVASGAIFVLSFVLVLSARAREQRHHEE